MLDSGANPVENLRSQSWGWAGWRDEAHREGFCRGERRPLHSCMDCGSARTKVDVLSQGLSQDHRRES